MAGKNFEIHGAYTLENALNLGIFTSTLSPVKTFPSKFLSWTPETKEDYSTPQAQFCFYQQQKRMAENMVSLRVLIMSFSRFRVALHFQSHCSHLTSDIAPVLSKEFPHIQAIVKCRFTLKWARDIIRTYSQIHRRNMSSQCCLIIWSVWLNGWVLVYQLSGCGFESRCSHSWFDLSKFNEKIWRWLETLDLLYPAWFVCDGLRVL